MIIFKNKKLIIPVGLGPNFQEGYEKIHNQNKTVDSSTVSQIVYPDSGFTGLGSVTVNPYELDAKTVDSSTEMQVVTSDKDGLYRVVVNPFHLDAVTIDSSTEYQTITGAYDEITVNPYVLDEKTVDSSTNPQVITSDEDGLRQVTIRPYVLSPLEVDSSTAAQTIEGAFNEVTVHPYVLDQKTVDSSTALQVVHSDNDGLSQVTINPYVLDEKTVNSSTNAQEITSDADGLSKVIINPYTLDEKTVNSSTNAQEITSDVDGLSKVIINPYILDEKTVDSSTNPQVITSDEDGLRQVTIRPYVLSPLEVDSSTARQEISGQYGTVTVNPYVLDSSNAVITENGDYAFESSADGLSRVDVSVNIDTQSYYDDGYSNGKTAGIAEQKAKLDSSTFTSNGTYTREDGWNKIEVTVPTVNNQNKTVDASINSQTITYDSGYTGLGTVTVNPYTLQYKAKELEPSFRNEDTRGAVVKVEPDEGYDGLSAFQYRLPSILTSKTFDASTGNQTYVTNTANTYVKGINKIVINGLDIDSCYTLAASI